MRFKKGSTVEVMNKEAPASWRVAEIVSGNGDAYNVRYNGCRGVEKLSRGNIRPYPPAISSPSWVTGDVVEVFDEDLWKIATVLKVVKGDRYMVRLHESKREIRVHKANIQAHQSWCDGRIPVGKISRTNEIEPSFSMKICQKKGECLPIYNDPKLKKPKRASPFSSSHPKAKKVKHADKDGSQNQSQRHSFEKSDNWRHASLASKRSIQESGSAAFYSEKAVRHQHIRLLQIRQLVAIWHLSEQLKHIGDSLTCQYLKLLARLWYFSATLI